MILCPPLLQRGSKRLLKNEGGLPWLCWDPHSVKRLSLFLWKRKPHLGNGYPRPEGINVSRCDMDRERVSNIAGLCLTADLTAWLVWQELEVSMERQLHVQNQLLLEAEMLSPCLAFLHNAEGFQQDIVTTAGSYLRQSGVRKICIPLPQPTGMHTLTLLAGAARAWSICLMHRIECDEGKAHTESQNCDSGPRDILQAFHRIPRQSCS